MYIRLERLIVRRSSTRLAIHGVGIPNINESKHKIHQQLLNSEDTYPRSDARIEIYDEVRVRHAGLGHGSIVSLLIRSELHVRPLY